MSFYLTINDRMLGVQIPLYTNQDIYLSTINIILIVIITMLEHTT